MPKKKIKTKTKKRRFFRKKKYSKYTMKNIYGKKLQSCRLDSSDYMGSWDTNGYCSELDGGVHQICMNVSNDTKDFAKDTHQSSNWSTNRINKPHCMCLGAWSLYKAKQKASHIKKTSNELNCHAIPEYALSKDYIDKWSTWNGNELPNQITEGINSLHQQCRTNIDDIDSKLYLDNLVQNIKRYY